MRTEKYRKIEALESFLGELNQNFSIIEKKKVVNFIKPKKPVVFIIGSPRSGTTMMMQYLANSGAFGYPSNFISRFYEAPYWGAQIQKLIFDPKYNFNNELIDIIPKITFNSYLGKTKGFLAPNEFWYFWRRFFKFNKNINHLNNIELKKVDKTFLLKELAGMETAFCRPMVFKGMMLNWHLDYLMDILKENVVFVYIKRNIAYNIQSLLFARKNFRGDVKTWYSFKPPEYNKLIQFNPEKQVAGQIYYTNLAIERQLEKMPQKNKIIIQYEDFCDSSQGLTNSLLNCFNQLGHEISYKSENKQFNSTNKICVDEGKWTEIIEAASFYY